MTLKVQMANGGADSVDFVNAAGTTLAQVKGYDDGSSNGHLELYTTASGTSTEQMRITSAGNVGIGTSSPSYKLHVSGTGYVSSYLTAGGVSADTSSALLFRGGNGSEAMRIDSSGYVLLGKTSAVGYKLEVQFGQYLAHFKTTTSTGQIVFIDSGDVQRGYIQYGSGGTTYATSSDYRLKENIKPMTGALSVVAQLKPVTYNWKSDGADGQGFIAHELQAVVPDCVTGEKDAVDANGNPVYQGIDTSFLVATLTAAIQEQQAIIQQLTARIETLESK